MDRRAFVGGSAAAVASLALGPAIAEEAVAAGVSKAERKRVQAMVNRYLTVYRAPGLSVAYSLDGALRYVASFGVADRATKAALTPAHRFRIASVTKPITASAVLLLVERGDLRLEQTVFGGEGILGPRFPLDDVPQRQWVETITVDHLLTHTAGGWGSDGMDPMFLYPGLDHAGLIAATLREHPLERPPGRSHAYSNFGYCLLGRVIEAITGAGYADFVRDTILAPSGAGGMEIAGNTAQQRKPNEVAYFGQDQSAYGMDVARMDSHGGWIGTPTDLVNFALHVDGFRSVPDLLARETVRLMHAGTKPSPNYARGWAINPALHNNWWHAGSLPGTSSMLIRAANGVNMAGLVNTRAGGNPDSLAALDALMWEIHAEVIG